MTNNSIKHQSFVYTQLNYQTVLFQTIQFNISTVFVYTQLNVNSWFQTIQFSVITQFSSTSFIDRTLSGAPTPGQSGPGNNENKGLLRISQRSSITRGSSSDCLVSYTKQSMGSSYSSAEKQSVYSAAPADWDRIIGREDYIYICIYQLKLF